MRHRGIAMIFLFGSVASGPWSAAAAAGEKTLTLELVYGADKQRRLDVDGRTLEDFSWIGEGDRYLERIERPQGGHTWRRVEAVSGRAEPLFDFEGLTGALAVAAEVDRKAAAAAMARVETFDAAGSAALALVEDDLFHLSFNDGEARRLTRSPEPEKEASFSPDGSRVAFVRSGDLHVLEVATSRERRLTEGGGEDLLNGLLDWVYQEEIYGRGRFRGYWWSPDSSRIAFLRLNESGVPRATVVDHLPTRAQLEVTPYPRPGDPIPRVDLGVVAADGGEVIWVDTSRFKDSDHLIVRVGWTPSGERLAMQVQDREQRWLELLLADPESGEVLRVLREETPAFVRVTGEPAWLEDGGFLWLSERSGFSHLYRYRRDGSLVARLTDGPWEVRKLHGVDRERRSVYFSSTEHRSIEEQIYRLDLEGGERQRISRFPGSHEALFSPDMGLYLDLWSDVQTPPRMTLHDADGDELRTVDANPATELAELALGEVELLQVPAADGYPLEAMLIRPPDFDPAKRYPVLQYNYGGPHAPVVKNSWGKRRYLWHQMLAAQGYLIWYCDNRSASGKGVEPTWEAHRRLGEVELADIEACLDWLTAHPWADASRTGIWGWSYGGYMAAYALTRSERFRVGFSGAPVTDWRLYDSVYTERYMGLLEGNEEGYRRSSVLEAAENLAGTLLLIHGTTDDNVHLQNTLKLADELQRAGRSFELMLYPGSRHRVEDPDQEYHLWRLVTDFLHRHLEPGGK